MRLIGWFLLLGMGGVLSAAERPNLLLIVSEDNGPELGCYGQPHVRTPVLDELAAGGMRFERAYVPQAGCSQSRAALLTGLYPHQNGQIGLAKGQPQDHRRRHLAMQVLSWLGPGGPRRGICTWSVSHRNHRQAPHQPGVGVSFRFQGNPFLEFRTEGSGSLRDRSPEVHRCVLPRIPRGEDLARRHARRRP